MRIGKFNVKPNYTILRGFLDVVGLLLAYLIVQTTAAFVNSNINPDAVLKSLYPADKYPNGVPPENWIWGFAFPLIAAAFIVLSIIYIVKPHKLPKNFTVTDENAQKYYDVLMIGNCLIRIIVLMSLWDLTYIHQSRLLYSNISWFSLQSLLGIAVAALVVFVLRRRVAAFASKKTDDEKKNDEIMRS